MSRRRLLVAGGGVGAVEALLAVRELAPDAFDVTLLAPGPALVLAPESVAEATGGAPARQFDLAAIAADLGVEHVSDALDAVDVWEPPGDDPRPEPPWTTTRCCWRSAPFPGQTLPGALRFAGVRDVSVVRDALERTADAPCPTIALVATGGVGWTLPLYELATLIAVAVRGTGPRAEPDRRHLRGRADERVRKPGPVARSRTTWGQLGIHVRTSTMAEAFERWASMARRRRIDRGGRRHRHAGAERTGGTRAFPSTRAASCPSIASDRLREPRGVGRRGHDGPPAQTGGLAIPQADVAARSIAAWAGAPVEPEPYEPVLRGLLLGDTPRYLRHSASSSVPSTSSERPLWSLDAKIVGGRLAPYLHAHPELLLAKRASADA